MAQRRARRTQEERSAKTRARLLDATVECLLKLGYARTTTTKIATRAKVSRGAQLHHFPTKQALVITAVEHVFARHVEEFRAAFGGLPPGADRAAKAVDLLWEIVTGPTFYAVLELIVAARTDPALRRSVTAVDKRFIERVRQTFYEVFPPPADPGPYFAQTPHFVLALMQGMALGRIVDPDEAKRQQALDFLKALSPVMEQRTLIGQEEKR